MASRKTMIMTVAYAGAIITIVMIIVTYLLSGGLAYFTRDIKRGLKALVV